MEITNYRYIKHMLLPADWQESTSEEGGIGQRSLRIFSPPDAPEVRMEIFYRGLPLNEKESQAFRHVLSGGPRLLFERNASRPPTTQDVNLLNELSEVLGNAGNNQVVNNRTDHLGPSFVIERIDTLNWQGKSVLALRGWFRNPDKDVRVYDYCGFFIDGNPSDPQCQVEEIFLEVANEELQLRYLPVFKECLNSLTWM